MLAPCDRSSSTDGQHAVLVIQLHAADQVSRVFRDRPASEPTRRSAPRADNTIHRRASDRPIRVRVRVHGHEHVRLLTARHEQCASRCSTNMSLSRVEHSRACPARDRCAPSDAERSPASHASHKYRACRSSLDRRPPWPASMATTMSRPWASAAAFTTEALHRRRGNGALRRARGRAPVDDHTIAGDRR